MGHASPALARIASWPNLLRAWQKASIGRRRRPAVAAFEFRHAEHLLQLQAELLGGRWQHGPYHRFTIHEPKRRVISAAALRDRVVHHALCQEIEPRFERVFIADSFANRIGKGTHRAIARAQELARQYRYVLRMDVRQHFPSIDHTVLIEALRRHVPEPDVLRMIRTILSSADVPAFFDDAARSPLFPGDDLLALCRPRGLPIGNLTSQFWSNVYLHALDLFVLRELRCSGYLRYVDDFALFGDDKARLWRMRQAVIERLQHLRLRVHESSAQVQPTQSGFPWLGMVVSPERLRLKSRKVRHATRHLTDRYDALCSGRITFAEFDASVQGWIAHARQADRHGGLRAHVLAPFILPPGCHPKGGAGD